MRDPNCVLCRVLWCSLLCAIPGVLIGVALWHFGLHSLFVYAP